MTSLINVDIAVVLDAGSSTFKAGLQVNFPSESEPQVVTPAAVRSVNEATESIGAAADFAGRGEIRAVEDGAIANWDAYETLVEDILYTQLGWEMGQEGPLLAGDALFTSKAEKERLTQLMFEHFNVEGLFLCDQAVLSLYAAGKLSGCVVDMGHTKVDIATVSEGQLYVPGTRRLPFGALSVSRHLAKRLQQRGVPVPDPAALDVLRDTIVRVADTAEEAQALISKGEAAPGETHVLPDGQSITVGSEGVELGEALLDGNCLGADTPSTSASIYNSCMSHPDPAARKVALEGLLVCGGGSSPPGLGLRLLRELRQMLPPSFSPGLIQAPEYAPSGTLKHSVFIGGAIVAKTVFQQNQHVSKFDYDEIGPTAIHRKL